MNVRVRLVSIDDVETLTEIVRAERAFLAPWQSERGDDAFTVEHQRGEVAQSLAVHRAGTALPYLILSGEEIIGRITVTNIVRSVFQSGDLGYWVRESSNGRGVATAAVAAMIDVAFGEIGLHRLQAGTLLHNLGSQRVLRRNGFQVIGTAPSYLRIAGTWQDHLLFQLINESMA